MSSRPDDRAERASGAGPGEPTTYNLLFVCTGNTCRSPMAEGLTRARVLRRGWKNVAVASAGTAAGAGAPATAEAVAVAREADVDLSEHRSRPLTPELVEWADRIIVMAPWHAQRVAALGGANKVSLATSLLDDDAGDGSVPDPIGGDEAVYRETLGTLRRVVDALLDHLEPILAP